MLSNFDSYHAILGPLRVSFDGRIVVVVRTIGVVLSLEHRLKPSANLIVSAYFLRRVPSGFYVGLWGTWTDEYGNRLLTRLLTCIRKVVDTYSIPTKFKTKENR